MSMKTIEEKRVAVLAYCDQEFSKIESAPYRIWHGQISVAMGLGGIFGIYLGSQKLIFEFWKDLNCRDSRWESAYQLIGLSERDAVAAEKARSFKEIDSCTLSLGKMAIRAKVAEAKNAALVAALEDMYLAYGTTVKIGQLNGLRTVQTNIGRDIKHALTANEKGGTK